MKNQQFIVIDGSNYLYRAYHALPPLSNQAGFPTQVILGTLNMMNKLTEHYTSDYMTVVFDPRGQNFRHQLYPDYKSNRPPTPEDLKQQFSPTRQIIENMGIPVFSIEGFEADDVIAHLATSAFSAGFKVYIVSSDKDLAQLVNERIFLFDPMRFRELDVQGVYEKFGVYPHQILDYLALKGDSADNIPGVPGVGEKTAIKWLKTYQTAENLMHHADEIKGKIGEKLRTHLDLLKLSKQLATLRTKGIDCAWEACIRKKPNIQELKTLYQKYELRHFLNKIEQASNVKSSYMLIQDEKKFETLMSQIKKCQFFCVDLETDSLDYLNNSIVGISISVKVHEGFYIPLQHTCSDAQLPPLWVLSKLKPFLENENIKKYGQNLKFDLQVFNQHDIALKGIKGDSMLASYVYNSSYNRHGLNELAKRHLNLHLQDYNQLVGDKKDFSEVSLEQACYYACSDSDVALRLNQFFDEKLSTQIQPKNVYEQIEIPLIDVLSSMEQIGVQIDLEKIYSYQQQAQIDIENVSKSIYKIAEQNLNLNSSAQLQILLFEKLKLPVIKKTPKGQPSTDEFVLQSLINEHPIAQKLLIHRSISKIKNTYLDVLPNCVHPLSGRIHTKYHQSVTLTGRLSSVDPNLQNIPVRGEWGKKLRQAFISKTGFCLIGSDYSQIELRMMAHLSGDETLIKAFQKNLDVHQQTASEIFEIPLEQVSPEQRYRAKSINFGIIYGISPFGLARQIKVDQKSARAYIKQYFNRYPKIEFYMKAQQEKAQKFGYVETLLGRRIYLPGIKSSRHAEKQHAMRVAINAPVQGSAADLIKKAMINLHHHFFNQDDIRLLMQVHDELVFEVPKSKAKDVSDQIEKLMTQNLLDLDVPIQVDIKLGDNWEQVH